jgi:hypothetical protein
MDTDTRVMLTEEYGKIQKVLLHALVEMPMDDGLMLFGSSCPWSHPI